jgi:adenosylmethionine-8-amino-7-oxononanoate aminotransferase
MTPAFVAEGVWVRPFSKLVYVMPPYVIMQEELSTLTNAIFKVIDAYGDAM